MVIGLARTLMPPPARPVPRWARIAAVAAALTPVPSSIGRIALLAVHESTTGLTLGMLTYLFALAAVTCGPAFLTIGLVARWGEVVPDWIPLIGGRVISRAAALVPAIAGGVIATLLGALLAAKVLGALLDPSAVPLAAGQPLPADALGFLILLYVPLLAWGPLLLAIAWHYHRRRSISDLTETGIAA